MPPTIEVIPNQAEQTKPLFDCEEDYALFRESFTNQAIPEVERTLEARRKSEQASRERLLR
jgi:hypothetical protein